MKILFLCTGNSCRSQMAEGWARELKGDIIEPFSAGIETHGLNPLAVEVMREVGVDISGHRSSHIDEFNLKKFAYLITVCDHAHESCPVVPPSSRVIHQGFDDPPRLAADLQDKQAILACYRRVRDQIKQYIETLPQSLPLKGEK